MTVSRSRLQYPCVKYPLAKHPSLQNRILSNEILAHPRWKYYRREFQGNGAGELNIGQASVESRENINKMARYTVNLVCTALETRDVKFGIQNGSDWPQMGQIRDFFRSDLSTFWHGEPKCTET